MKGEKIMKYVALLDQGEGGCDYTIHCGRDWEFFEAQDDNAALAELRRIMFIDPDEQGPEDGDGPYTGEKKLEGVTLVCVSSMAEVNINDWYRQWDAEQARTAQTEKDDADRQQYERLKAKFG